MKNSLFITGQKFKVIEPTKDTAFGIGSLGFVSFLEKMDSSFMNVAQLQTTIIRKGKGGKHFPLQRRRS